MNIHLTDIAKLNCVDIKKYLSDILREGLGKRGIAPVFKNDNNFEHLDVLIFSDHGRENIKYDCLKIYFSDENIRPDFNIANYCIGFDHIIYDNYMRFPLWLMYEDDLNLALNKHNFDYTSEYKKDRFACFLVSNNFAAMRARKDIFYKLSEYKKIDSGGSFLNNIGYKVENKREFQKRYKFCLCIENSSYSGYSTEKLLQGFASGCVPIYFGDKDISNDKFCIYHNGSDERFCGFNKDAFINIHDFRNLDECIKYIKEVDSNHTLFEKYLKTPALDIDYINFYKQKLTEFLTQSIMHPDFSSHASARVIWKQINFLESKMTLLQKILKKPIYKSGNILNLISHKIMKKNIINIKKYDIYFKLKNKQSNF